MGAFLSIRIAPTSKPIAIIHDTIAIIRRFLAFALLSSVATNVLVDAVGASDPRLLKLKELAP